MRKPFTKEEQEVLDFIVDAHNNFIKLENTHPLETAEWVDAIHRLQHLLMARVLRRDYPDTFK
jgi:hypothetical protein